MIDTYICCHVRVTEFNVLQSWNLCICILITTFLTFLSPLFFCLEGTITPIKNIVWFIFTEHFFVNIYIYIYREREREFFFTITLYLDKTNVYISVGCHELLLCIRHLDFCSNWYHLKDMVKKIISTNESV